MKFLCSHCDRLLPLETFRLDGAALVVTCAKCGVESRVEPATAMAAAAPQASSPAVAPEPARPPPKLSLASVAGASNVVVLRTASHDAVQRAAESAAAPFAIPDGLCPKCLARKGTAPACAHCGVTFEVFEESTVLPPKFLRDEWVQLLGDWGNEAAHAQFRRKAQQVDALPAIGRLYRLRQAHFAEDPLAAEALADILRLASVPMALPRTESDDSPGWQKVLVLGVGLVLLVLVVFALRLMFATGAPLE